MQLSITEATANLHSILEPFPPQERTRPIQAVLVLLGDPLPPRVAATSTILGTGSEGTDAASELPLQTKAWMQKYTLSLNAIESLIHIDGANATVIELPTNDASAKQKTRICYLMTGLAALFSNGEPSFADEAAREVCRHFGCYDQKNHATYVKALGNSVAGSKSAGWKLTTPGLSAVASLIREARNRE